VERDFDVIREDCKKVHHREEGCKERFTRQHEQETTAGFSSSHWLPIASTSSTSPSELRAANRKAPR
jgi:hypothetical protein